jgi:2-polyprenyl-3-methyl-5-hydroxy-6-metoxy-1,4-benzoquinol methylase
MRDEQRNPVCCNLCAADDCVQIGRKFDLTIVRCRQCSLVYTNPLPSLDFIWSRYSPEYFEQEYLPAWGVHAGQVDPEVLYQRHLPTLESVRPYRQTNWLLDVGAGAGLFLHAAQQDGWQVQGVEIASAGVEFARSRLGLDVIQGRMTEVDLPSEHYDVVVMQETIEHLLDPMAVLKEIHRVLRLGGMLSMTTPNFNSLTHKLVGREWSVLSPGEHLFYFTPQTLCTMLERAGLVNIGVSTDGALNADQVHTRTLRVRAAQHLVRRLSRFHRCIARMALGDVLVASAERPVL